MNEPFCKTCGEYKWSHAGTHVCPPAYECRFDEAWKDERDWCEERARSAETAAEKFAEEFDCENEYGILMAGDNCLRIIEVRATDGTITRFNIRAESIPHYYADEIEKEVSAARQPEGGGA